MSTSLGYSSSLLGVPFCDLPVHHVLINRQVLPRFNHQPYVESWNNAVIILNFMWGLRLNLHPVIVIAFYSPSCLVPESSCHLPTSLPHTAEASHCPFNCWTSSREAMNTNSYCLLFHPTGNRTVSTVLIADALFTWSLVGKLFIMTHSWCYNNRTVSGRFIQLL